MLPVCALLLLASGAPFRIEVVDDATGRGVPLVELRTTHEAIWITDSNGLVAFDEPGLMERPVFFFVSSHGYEMEKDGFGFAGKVLETRRGGRATLRLRRTNVAQRLCRLTGAGIYRDTALLGEKPPLAEPLLNAQVTGQDSVQALPWKGGIFWLWGDTARPGYPLGNFGATAALSDAGDDPEDGIDFRYFTGPDGFARPMCAMEGPGPLWIDGLAKVEGRMIGVVDRVKELGVSYERALVTFDERTERFVPIARLPLDAPRYPRGRAVEEAGYLYWCSPWPLVRARADFAQVSDPAAYEALTDVGWSATAPLLDESAVRRRFPLRDVETGREVRAHSGSIRRNRHRDRYLLVAVEAGGSSFLGEVWYAEAPSLLGPWVYARKIVTHDRYSFYNPVHHDFLDRGRHIYFEGTYSQMFSGAPAPTPRYDYNQVLYRLDLDDGRLVLPEPVAGGFFACRRPQPGLLPFEDAEKARFYACPPGAAPPATVPLHRRADGALTLEPAGEPVARVWPTPPGLR